MQITILKKDDIDEKKKTRKLYEECFDEGKTEYIDYYYDVIIKRNEMVVLKNDDGDIISMVHLNPYLYNIDGIVATVHYIVAVATKEGYRGMGYMKMIMEVVIDYLYEKEEPFCYLVPEDNNIEELYKTIGFEVVSGFTIDKFSKERYDIYPVETDEYKKLMDREQVFLEMESDEYKKELSIKNVMMKMLITDKINIKTLDDMRNKKIYVCQEV